MLDELMIVKYSLHIKDIYLKTKEKVLQLIHSSPSLIISRKTVMMYSLKHAGEAFREGYTFGAAWSEMFTDNKTTAENKITPKDKAVLLKEFLNSVKFAEKIFTLRSEHRKMMLKDKGINRDPGGGDVQIEYEYERAVLRAVNRLFIHAGQIGFRRALQ